LPSTGFVRICLRNELSETWTRVIELQLWSVLSARVIRQSFEINPKEGAIGVGGHLYISYCCATVSKGHLLEEITGIAQRQEESESPTPLSSSRSNSSTQESAVVIPALQPCEVDPRQDLGTRASLETRESSRRATIKKRSPFRRLVQWVKRHM